MELDNLFKESIEAYQQFTGKPIQTSMLTLEDLGYVKDRFGWYRRDTRKVEYKKFGGYWGYIYAHSEIIYPSKFKKSGWGKKIIWYVGDDEFHRYGVGESCAELDQEEIEALRGLDNE